MTTHHDLKSIIRQRQLKTGESYTAARVHVMRDRADLLGLADRPEIEVPILVEAAVLKVNQQSARVRLLESADQLTFRSTDACTLVPGFIVKLQLAKRWIFNGASYATGSINGSYLDIARLGLQPLPLEDHGLDDLAASTEPFRRPDPYAPMWRRRVAQPRPSFEMHGIAWGAEAKGSGEDAYLVCDAAELTQAGEVEAARAMLMEVVCQDLRCIDAHAHLGNLEFDDAPAAALMHYEVGVRIGELSLPPGFDGYLLWGVLYNRPFLRALKGYGLGLWRLGRRAEAQQVFERILSLNPTDNQGVRFCLHDLLRGEKWEDLAERDDRLHAQGMPPLLR